MTKTTQIQNISLPQYASLRIFSGKSLLSVVTRFQKYKDCKLPECYTGCAGQDPELKLRKKKINRSSPNICPDLLNCILDMSHSA